MCCFINTFVFTQSEIVKQGRLSDKTGNATTPNNNNANIKEMKKKNIPNLLLLAFNNNLYAP